MLGLARLLLDPLGDPVDEVHRRTVELIAGSASELLHLVNELLDLAKAEFGRLEPAISTTDVAALVAEVVDAVRPLAPPAVRLIAGTLDGPPLLTDGTLLRQVLRNLLANAVAFTTEGTVAVELHRVEGELTIDVVDSGVGIAAEDLERIFDEFYQVRGPLQAHRRGTGLGLPYSRRVAQLLGGRCR